LKRIICSLSILIWLSSSAQVRVGVLAGPHSSDINNRDLVTTKRLTSIHAGVMADFSIAKSDLHLFSRVLYAPMGYGKSDFPVVDAIGNQYGIINSHRIGYVQLPLYILYGTNGSKVNVSGGLGPFIAFKTGDKMELIANGTSTNAKYLPAGVERINSSFTGIGFYIGVEWSSILLSFEVQQSLVDIYKNQVGDNKWKVNSFGLSLGYFFSK
jgi:hypothetical protein